MTSAQAWHWLDMPAATAKTASLSRPNGSLGLIWSGGAHPDELEEVYSTVVPWVKRENENPQRCHEEEDVWSVHL